MKTSSSTITGMEPAGSSTPPIWDAALRCTRFPTCAHDPTSAWESIMVCSPRYAPILMYEGGMITTPGPMKHPSLGVRIVAGGTAARDGCFIGPGVGEEGNPPRVPHRQDRRDPRGDVVLVFRQGYDAPQAVYGFRRGAYRSRGHCRERRVLHRTRRGG